MARHLNREQSELLVWVDVETTGLDSNFELPLELGIAVTDLNGVVVGAFDSLVLDPMWGTKMANAPTVVQDMHSESGLWQALTDANGDDMMYFEGQIHRVDSRAVTFLAGLKMEFGVHPLCGSTINFDRAFMEKYFPGLFDFFHYRNIDISTVRGLCQKLNPDLFEKFQGTKGDHRVLNDIQASIDLYRFMKDEFLLTTVI